MREVASTPRIRKVSRPSVQELRDRLAERGALEVFATVARTHDIPLDRLLDLWVHEPRVIAARCEAYALAWETLNLSSEELGRIVEIDRSCISLYIRRAYEQRRERRRGAA